MTDMTWLCFKSEDLSLKTYFQKHRTNSALDLSERSRGTDTGKMLPNGQRIVLFRVVNPHKFNADPDPAFFLIAGPDPDTDTDPDPAPNPGILMTKN
jgi:hypothetical protein